MDVPPVGPPPIPPNNQGGDSRRGANKTSRAPKEATPAARRAERSEKIAFSSDARKIQQLQKDVSRIQIATRVAEKIDKTMSRIVEAGSRLQEVNKTSKRDASKYRSQIDADVRNLKDLHESAVFDDQPLLNGDPLRFYSDGAEVSVETPGIFKDPRDVIRDILAVAEGRKKATEFELPAQLKKFQEQANAVKSKLEAEVREAVAKNMRESSGNVPRDVYSAEKLLNSMRGQDVTSNPSKPDDNDSPDTKAVDILK